MPVDVRDPFGINSKVRSGSVWANFGPKFSEPKIYIFKRFQVVRPSPPRRGPSIAAVPSPAARRAPAATAAQNENFSENLWNLQGTKLIKY